MKKLIAIDLDCTLLSPFLSVSSFTKKVVKRLTYEGHVVVLASGRPYRAMKKLYEDLFSLSSPLICYNGGYVFIPNISSFPKLERKFPSSSLKRIALANKNILLSFMTESEDNIYLSKKDDYLDHYFPWKKKNIKSGKWMKSFRKIATPPSLIA